MNIEASSGEWPMVQLGDITTKIGSGATPCGGKESYIAEGISLIRSMNVYDSVFQYSDLAHIGSAQAELLKNVIVEENDVLLNITGASVARCCLVPKAVLPARVNQHVALVRSDRTKSDPFYIHYCLVSPYYKDLLLSIAQGGATREALTKEKVEDFRIPLPPLPVQQKIASILSAYDNLIENNLRRIKILEEMAQNLFREWFVKFRFPGHERSGFAKSSMGNIPKDWSAITLADCTSLIKRGISPKYDASSNSVVINQKCIRDLRLNLVLSRGHIKKVPAEKYIKFGDVLINSTGIGTLGRVCQVMEDVEDCTVDSHVTIVRPSEEVNTDYFGLQLFELQSHFERLGQGATGQTELGRIAVEETEFLSAPPDLQKLFSEMVKPLRVLGKLLVNRDEVLKCSRDLLLPKLISGELEVSALDIKIPKEISS